MRDKKETIVQRLSETREPLLAFLQGLDEAAWETAVQSEDAQWSISDIVRHLVNAEKGMTGLIVEFQKGNNPVPADFDLARFNQRGVEKAQILGPNALLATMKENRSNLLTFIATLNEEDWQKKGRHASLAIYTIEEVCQIIAGHEANHLADMQKAINGNS